MSLPAIGLGTEGVTATSSAAHGPLGIAIGVGVEVLRQVTAAAPHDLAALPGHVIEAMVGDERNDDVALLAVRVKGD